MWGNSHRIVVRLGCRNLSVSVAVVLAAVDSSGDTSAISLLYGIAESVLDYPRRTVLLVGNKSSADMPPEV